MRTPTLGILLFAALCCFLAPQDAKAQYAYGISAIQYDDQRNVVDAYSVTELDYAAGYYYDPYVEGYLYRGNSLVNAGSSLGYRDYIDAVVHTSTNGTSGTQFTLESDHYIVAYYYYYDCYYGCGYYYYDPWGYRFAPGGDYGGNYGFPGFSSPGYVLQQYYYLGTTAVQITTPSECQYDDDGFGFLPGGTTPSESCVLAPELTGPASVTRGSSATFTLRNTAARAVINWQFTSGLGTVTKSGGTTWSGTMVAGGTITATVTQGGRTTPLTRTISVSNRDNFAFSTLPATKVPNGTVINNVPLQVSNTPTSQDGSGDTLGKFYLHLPSSYRTSDIGGGPNAGFKYVTGVTQNAGATYSYVISPDVENPDSAFYKAQCGNYNPQTDTGFISGAALLANTIRHEAGDVQSHYRNYKDAIEDESKNPGVAVERLVAGPSTSMDNFGNTVNSELNGKLNAVLTATRVEPCGRSDVTLDASCTKSGNINFAPYQACPTQPPGGGTNAGSFVSQSVPYSMEAGYAYDVSVTMRNTGTSTWTDAAQFRLGSQNPRDNYTWGMHRVALPTSVPPGGEVTFNFYVTAPSYTGGYNFQWQMVQDGVEWFGNPSPNSVVDVYSSNYCDWWQEQDCYNRGGSWDSSSCTCYGGYYNY